MKLGNTPDHSDVVSMSFGNTLALAVRASKCCSPQRGPDASQSKTELYAAIRRDVRGGMSIRAAMRKYSVSYPTVTKAMTSAWPEPRKNRPRGRPVWMSTSR
ncbi:hypothetical protein GCM10022226_70970 [Sphaerisporangium flaviroseum]|uniref:HTH psq-type domain-containing protein n=2 Tax=Sphaerisporangium flaviroseum TaxID=509199 RepID=A0ABP7J9E2_9ACTN